MPRFVPVALPAAMVAATLAWFAAVQAREASGPDGRAVQAVPGAAVARRRHRPCQRAPPRLRPRRTATPAAPVFGDAAQTALVKQDLRRLP